MAYPYRPYKKVFSAEEVREMCIHTDLSKRFSGELVSHYRPPFSSDFSNQEYTFVFDNGITMYYKFVDAHTLQWSEDGIHFETEYYEALESTVRKVYLIHHLRQNCIPYEALTLVIDTEAMLITCVHLGIGTEVDDKAVRSNIYFGYYGKDRGVRHSMTDEMCGVVLDWKYTDDFIIRHTYVTPDSLTSPGEPSDNEDDYLFRKTLPASYVKIRSGLYIVSFIEDGGAEASLLIDLNRLRDVGAFFGLGESGQLFSYTIGAVAGRGKFGFTGKYSIEYGAEPEK